VLAGGLTIILPEMTMAEAIESTRLPRIAGRTGGRTVFVAMRPCRASHDTLADIV
jgi:predicted ATPase with chaperone activity